ncbi:ead/Ea22-like family protein [Serratia nevei]|uniref:ead/Ea22-like family protein n=1 Tax=Serratia TaxID=613 RepID=UPI00066B8744|nr:ead/Ea22-like family protein [Serratia marcescens]BEN40817.1 hypothetical protein SMKC049_26090 [Serratia marcescens]
MDKFSELKAAADKYSLTLSAHRENPKDVDAVDAWDEADGEFSALINNNEMEIIINLLAELEAKDKRIAELEERENRVVALAGGNAELWETMAARLEAAEARLATPIKIVNYDEFFICHVSGASDDYCKGWVDGRNAAARDVGKAGFTVAEDA